jgi:N-acetylmuramoyl-L-alanine amidase
MVSRPNQRRWPVFLGAAACVLLNSSRSDASGGTAGSRTSVVVAIDPGHGGTNLGASGPERGVYEKAVTLALAERVRALLTDESPHPTSATMADGAPTTPHVVVVLCRTSDDFVPIRARSRCARETGARLFLSLHANAVPAGVERGSQRGFEVFVLGPREIEDDAALATLGQPEDGDAIWRAHAVRASGEASIALARLVADRLTEALGADANRGVKQSGAALDVLRGAGTAAALVEIGFLDHPKEGALLAASPTREPIARALAAAIRTYVTEAGVPGAAPRSKPGHPALATNPRP